MSYLGLVGMPMNTVTYPVYQGLKALSPALGAALAGAEVAAIASLAAQGAAVVGAGALGWMIGTAIREQLLPGEPPLALSTWVSGGVPGEQVNVEFTFYNPPNAPISTNVILTAPFAGVLRRTIGPDFDQFYLRQTAPPAFIEMVSFSPSLSANARVEITALKKLDGTPAENLRKVPVLPQKPFVPQRYPVVIPATPQYPAIPITPTVVPTPGNDPDEDNKAREPGITVKIPELGLQIQYTPTGVRIGRYTDPETRAFDPPKIGLPPGYPGVAEDPCPCPEDGNNKDEEILCRIKTLQKVLLDDGYITTTNLAGPSSYLSVDGLPDEFYRLEIGVTQKPLNVKTQSYSVADATVEWVGWLSWQFGGRKSDRIFLQFAQMGFSPPPECTGYTIAFNNGCAGNALALTRKKKDYIDLC